VEAVPPFELTAKYDEACLRAATRVLFRRLVMWQLPLTVAVVLGVIGCAVFLWYLRLRGLAWILVAYPLLFPVLWLFGRWNIQRSLMKRLGKSVHVRMTSEDFSIALEGESHTFPWSRFKSTLTDEHNLYLFIAKRTAFIVPTQGVVPDALEFAIARVGVRGTAV
jgi:YcxB-like protein